jgi:hypothetical protein
MHARPLAMCCLLYVSIASGGSEIDVGKNVVVYLKPADGLSAAALEQTKNELVFVMRGIGTRIVWWDAEKSQSGTTETLIVADFTGTCSVPSSASAAFDISSLPPLAHAPIADGHILPFAYVDCAALGQFVGPVLARQPKGRHELLYGRAVGRLLAHEIYHILAQTPDHAAAGIAKEHFSTTDLLAARFQFETAAMAHLLEMPISLRLARTPSGL